MVPGNSSIADAERQISQKKRPAKIRWLLQGFLTGQVTWLDPTRENFECLDQTRPDPRGFENRLTRRDPTREI